MFDAHASQTPRTSIEINKIFKERLDVKERFKERFGVKERFEVRDRKTT